MPPPMTKETRMYLAIWRRAFLTRNDPATPPMKLKASSFSTALTMRQGLYRAIRPYREGTAFDSELTLASEALVVAVLKNLKGNLEPHFVELKPRTTLTELEAELASLGLSDDDLMLPGEKENLASMGKLLEKADERPANPFYDRRT